jgi:DNA topoisomerase II
MPVKELTIEQIYQKKEQIEHALESPDTYIGSVELSEEAMWVVDSTNNMMKLEMIIYVPGLYKIYDEIVVNALDHWTRMDEYIKQQKAMKAGKMEETPEITLEKKLKAVKNIRIDVDQKEGEVTIFNDGNGVPIAFHNDEKVWLPEMLFSQLLTSGNYKTEHTNQTRIIGGKNGYGASLAALFSTHFTIETVDAERRKKYTQTYENNLKVIHPPVIETCNSHPYTKIKFKPDLKRFHLETLTDDMVKLFEKRAYDAAGWCNGVTITYNNKVIPVQNFNQYIDLYLGDDRVARKRVYVKANERWEICATYSDDNEFQQVSMVNGILTSKGGKHINHVADQICKEIAAHLTKGKTVIDAKHVRNNLWIFVHCIIENPTFDSQTKEYLNTNITSFGSRCNLSVEDIKKMGSCGINSKSKSFADFKDSQVSKTDGKKIGKITGISQLVDAAYAGKKHSTKCVLILTEGDSAKGYAVKGLSALNEEERKYYGIFPLRGKVLNVRDTPNKKIDLNIEISNLKKILGLQNGIDYSGTNINKLRYGKVKILTDADTDGFHIQGLLMNLFHAKWPSLLKNNNFLTYMPTKVVQVWKERKINHMTTVKTNVMKFYSEQKYLKWKQNNAGNGWEYAYYKGLASSSETDAQEDFAEMKVINYVYDKDDIEDFKGNAKINTCKVTEKPVSENNSIRTNDVSEDNISEAEGLMQESSNSSLLVSNNIEDGTVDVERRIVRATGKPNKVLLYAKNKTDDAMILAFGAFNADRRKEWLLNANLDTTIDFEKTEETYSEFVHNRLIHYSWEDTHRSIPNICDGFKPALRKVMYYMLKCKDKKSSKVSEHAGGISKETGYHHGEAGLCATIIGLAQNYVGSNNINLLYPDGLFGSRNEGGADAGSPRYIRTKLESITPYIFKSEDNPLYNYLDDDGKTVEPEWFLPIIPMILVNGVMGMGTGFASYIPQYDPMDIVMRLEQMLKGLPAPDEDLRPYYRGFKGSVVRTDDNKHWWCIGRYEIKEDKIKVIELPAGGSSSSFRSYNKVKERLEEYETMPEHMKSATTLHKVLKDLTFDPTVGSFEITLKPDGLNQLMEEGLEKLESTLHIRSRIALSNMVLFDATNHIRKYNTAQEILEDYFKIRLVYYQKRLDHLLNELEYEKDKATAKLRFVIEIMEDKLNIYRKKKQEIILLLEQHKYPKFTSSVVTEDDEDDNIGSYNYLLSMKISSFSYETIEKLTHELNHIENQINELHKSTASTLWLKDLDTFKTNYTLWLSDWYGERKIEQPEQKLNIHGMIK